jgi:hypothetical protein
MKLISDHKVSKNMEHHLKSEKTLVNNTFRYGSDSFCDLICEARKLFNSDALDDLDEDDYDLLCTEAGEPVMYKEKEVRLEIPEREWNWEEDGWYFVYVRTGEEISKINFKG